MIRKVYSTIIGCNIDIWQNYHKRNNAQIWLQFMLYDAQSAFILYKAILFSIHNSRIACFLWYFALKLRNACHYKLAYTETLKIKIISRSYLQNENARRFFCSCQSTRSVANQNACFKSCFYVKGPAFLTTILFSGMGIFKKMHEKIEYHRMN